MLATSGEVETETKTRKQSERKVDEGTKRSISKMRFGYSNQDGLAPNFHKGVLVLYAER